MPTEPDIKPVDTLRIELLARVLNDIKWFVSEVVLCRAGSSRQMLRMLKRYHRLEGIIKRLKENTAEPLTKSPYAATLGARLTLNGNTIEQFAPYGIDPTVAELETKQKVRPPDDPMITGRGIRARARARV